MADKNEPKAEIVTVFGGRGVAEIINSWLAGMSPDTLKNYSFDLKQFACFLGMAGDINAAAASLFSRSQGEANGLVFSYRAHLLSKGLAPASINRHLSSLTSLVKVARMVGLVPWGLDVPRMKVEGYRDTRGPGKEGFLALMAELDKRTGAGAARDRLVLRLLYERGLRIKEVLGIGLEHVDLDGLRVSILGKGRRTREWVTLAGSTIEALQDWLAIRGDAPGALICKVGRYWVRHPDGPRAALRPISRQMGYRIVRQLGEAIGIRARPHGLRHSAITAALDAGADIRSVQRFSRHKNIATLMIYDDNRRDLGGDVARLIAEPVNQEVATRARTAEAERVRRIRLFHPGPTPPRPPAPHEPQLGANGKPMVWKLSVLEFFAGRHKWVWGEDLMPDELRRRAA